MTTAPVRLSNLEPFSQGCYRKCFVHPDDPGLCIKVNHLELDPRTIRGRARPWKRLRPLHHFDQTLSELRHYRHYERFYSDEIWAHIPKCHGMIATDMGEGLVVDLITNADGQPARRVSHLIAEDGAADLDPALETFIEFLRKHRLLTHELRLQNLVVARDDAAPPKIYIVDAIGLSDFLPLAYYLKGVAERKVERKIERLRKRIEAARESGVISE